MMRLVAIHVAIIQCHDKNFKVNGHVSMIMFQYGLIVKHLFVVMVRYRDAVEIVIETCFSVNGSVALSKDYFVIIITFKKNLLVHLF